MNTPENENVTKADALIAELNTLHPIPNVPRDDWMDISTLKRLSEILDELSATDLPTRAVPALFGVFERFPFYDGYESFWGILHLLETMYVPETAAFYEKELIASVRRVPVEFNIMMVNRLINGGETRTGDTALIEILRETATRTDISDEAREEAQRYVGYQESK